MVIYVIPKSIAALESTGCLIRVLDYKLDTVLRDDENVIIQCEVIYRSQKHLIRKEK